mmetsp:Transcript_14314/g.27323  ORF Transcript_14314/g.27323 Transcript_14314/m.27323 type:complete len:81 (+) Transcript_14314:852-1094(+)
MDIRKSIEVFDNHVLFFFLIFSNHSILMDLRECFSGEPVDSCSASKLPIRPSEAPIECRASHKHCLDCVVECVVPTRGKE